MCFNIWKIYFANKVFINLNVVGASAFLFVVGSQYAAKKNDSHNGSTGDSVDNYIDFRICRRFAVDRATRGNAGLVFENVAWCILCGWPVRFISSSGRTIDCSNRERWARGGTDGWSSSGITKVRSNSGGSRRNYNSNTRNYVKDKISLRIVARFAVDRHIGVWGSSGRTMACGNGDRWARGGTSV